MKYFLHVVKCYFIIVYVKMMLYFGIKRNTKSIPIGSYCYVPDIEKNKNKKEGDMYYYIKPCKYYLFLKGQKSGCSYLGFIGNNLCHWDQCKACNINLNKDGD